MNKWIETLGSVAPVLATALGGPLAGTATKFIAGKLLGNEDANNEDISSAIIGASPDTLVQLKQIDLDFKVEMERAGVDVFKIKAGDKRNARKEHKDSWMPAFLSVGLTLSVAGIIYLLFFMEPPEGSRDVLFMVLGVLIKEWGGAMQYWFGTTRSSQLKTAMIK